MEYKLLKTPYPMPPQRRMIIHPARARPGHRPAGVWACLRLFGRRVYRDTKRNI